MNSQITVCAKLCRRLLVFVEVCLRSSTHLFLHSSSRLFFLPPKSTHNRTQSKFSSNVSWKAKLRNPKPHLYFGTPVPSNRLHNFSHFCRFVVSATSAVATRAEPSSLAQKVSPQDIRFLAEHAFDFEQTECGHMPSYFALHCCSFIFSSKINTLFCGKNFRATFRIVLLKLRRVCLHAKKKTSFWKLLSTSAAFGQLAR